MKFKNSTTRKDLDDELARLKAKKYRLEIEMEKLIYEQHPDAKERPFVPPFGPWWMLLENNTLNLDDALEKFIVEFDLVQIQGTDGGRDAAVVRAKLAALAGSRLTPTGEEAEVLAMYKFSLMMQTRAPLPPCPDYGAANNTVPAKIEEQPEKEPTNRSDSTSCRSGNRNIPCLSSIAGDTTGWSRFALIGRRVLFWTMLAVVLLFSLYGCILDQSRNVS